MIARVSFVVLALILGAAPARAENCPDEVPADNATRRSQAKVWFSRGEAATNAGDQIAALKAYQCSLRLVPHGFTAFNIAQAAEQVGDLELAISGYNQYLLLVPDAKDSVEVNERLNSLRERLTKLRKEDLGAVTAAAAGGSPSSASGPQPTKAVPKAYTPPPQPPEATTTSESETEVSAPSHRGSNYRTAAWITYGAAVAIAVGGVIANRMGQSKMDSCNRIFGENLGQRTPAAETECNDAKPLVYGSYAAFGVAGAAALLGTFFVLRPTESSDVAMGILPEGGLSLRWGGRY